MTERALLPNDADADAVAAVVTPHVPVIIRQLSFGRFSRSLQDPAGGGDGVSFAREKCVGEVTWRAVRAPTFGCFFFLFLFFFFVFFKVQLKQMKRFITEICFEYTSAYRGVSWHTRANKWRAQCTLEGKKVHIGLFDDEEDAADAHTGAYTNYVERGIPPEKRKTANRLTRVSHCSINYGERRAKETTWDIS